MTLSHGDCQRIVDAFAQAKLPLFVAYYRRSLPRFLQVKQWIDARAIGELRTISLALFRTSTICNAKTIGEPIRASPVVAVLLISQVMVST